MYKAIEQLENLVRNIISDYSFVDNKRVSVWCKEGNFLNSEVELLFEGMEINYDLRFFLEKKGEESLSAQEIFVFLHEISHVIILEKIRTKNGSDALQNYIDEYNKTKRNLDKKIERYKWNNEKAQEEYEKIDFEKKASKLALKLYNRYVRIASL